VVIYNHFYIFKMANLITGAENRFKDDKSRTYVLTAAYSDNMLMVEKMDAYQYLTDDEKTNLRTALLYLRGHTNMITYKFKDDKLYKIILGPSWKTVLPTSRRESCANMCILFKFFKKSFEGSGIDVELSDRCTPETSKTSETNGGYKSRRRNRKPARKTRRRGRDRRVKSHHKKYTH
jgi:hypothetical protein